MDAKFRFDEWSALTQKEALDAIRRLVLRASMQAVQWSELFSACQGQEESVTDFFMRCAQSACDCGFQCHQCSVNNTEYLLLKRLTLGLSDVELKQVYQMCNSINSVDTLRPMCCSYEAAREDAVSCSLWRETIRAAGTAHAGEEEDSHTPDAAASMVTRYNSHSSVENGVTHAPDKTLCPARDATCLSCRKQGHFKRCSRGSKRQSSSMLAYAVSGAVRIASTSVSCQPTVKVTMVYEGGAEHQAAAVADSGAQVCITGRYIEKNEH